MRARNAEQFRCKFDLHANRRPPFALEDSKAVSLARVKRDGGSISLLSGSKADTFDPGSFCKYVPFLPDSRRLSILGLCLRGIGCIQTPSSKSPKTSTETAKGTGGVSRESEEIKGASLMNHSATFQPGSSLLRTHRHQRCSQQCRQWPLHRSSRYED